MNKDNSVKCKIINYHHAVLCGDYADNTRTATNKQVEIVAVLPAATPGGEDEISAVTGRVFVAKTPERFTYDADGNMTSDGRFTYTWNDENRMVSASNAEVVVTYAYDHKGRMIRKTISRGDAEPQSITYLWDGWNIIRESRVTGLAFHVSGLARKSAPPLTSDLQPLPFDLPSGASFQLIEPDSLCHTSRRASA